MPKGKNREKRKKKEGPLEPSSGAHPNLTRLLAYSCVPVDASPFFFSFFLFLSFSSFPPTLLGLFVFYFFFSPAGLFRLLWCFSLFSSPSSFCFFSLFLFRGWVGGIFFQRGLGTRKRLLKRNNTESFPLLPAIRKDGRKQRFLFGETVVLLPCSDHAEI